jgi:Tfp pilus assembly protein PilN
MVNLLPIRARRALIRDYYLRLAALALFLIALVTVLGGLLLVPSFFLARATAQEAARYRAALEETVGLKERAGVAAQVATLSERVRLLDTFAASPATPAIVATLMDAMPRGVTLTALSIARTGTGASLVISGSAGTRDALLSLAASLKSVTTFSGVSLPVSSLVSDADIPFTIGFTYTAPAP